VAETDSSNRLQEQANRIADMEDERNKLKEQIAELTSRIESLEGENVVNAHQVSNVMSLNLFLLSYIGQISVDFGSKCSN
jgi:prefoldin subunit 5